MTTGQLSEYKAWSSLCIKYERNMFIRCPILILQTLFSLGLCQFVCKHTYKVLGSRDSLKVWSMATEARIMSLNPGMYLRILLTFMCQITFVYHGIKDKRKHLEGRTNFRSNSMMCLVLKPHWAHVGIAAQAIFRKRLYPAVECQRLQWLHTFAFGKILEIKNKNGGSLTTDNL